MTACYDAPGLFPPVAPVWWQNVQVQRAPLPYAQVEELQKTYVGKKYELPVSLTMYIVCPGGPQTLNRMSTACQLLLTTYPPQEAGKVSVPKALHSCNTAAGLERCLPASEATAALLALYDSLLPESQRDMVRLIDTCCCCLCTCVYMYMVCNSTADLVKRLLLSELIMPSCMCRARA